MAVTARAAWLSWGVMNRPWATSKLRTGRKSAVMPEMELVALRAPACTTWLLLICGATRRTLGT